MEKTVQKTLDTIAGQSQEGWNDSKPYWWNNQDATERKKTIIRDLAQVAFSGEPEERETKDLYNYGKKSLKNAREIAEVLVDVNTYTECEPDFDEGEKRMEEWQKAKDNYDGIDALVYCSQEELAYNIMEEFMPIEKAIKFLKK